ncbi:MAG: HAMP domain-containing histidine kinase [Desulfobacula sp.]|nr:HAMP domain-containing histidine kinase [Desulfobacula sp.]
MKLTVYKKMMLGFGIIILIMIISSTYVLFELKSVSGSAKYIITENVRTQELARQLQAIIQDENGYLEKYLISNDDSYFSLFLETGKQVDQNLKLLDEQQSLGDHPLIHGMIKTHNALFKAMQAKRNAADSPDKSQEQAGQQNMILLLDSLDVLINKNQTFIQNEIGRIESITARSVRVALLLIVGTLIAAIAAAFIITQTITRPIGDLIKGTKQIARGNFDNIHVSSNDEISLLADAVNDMSVKINDTNIMRTQTMQQISHELKTPLQAVQSAHDVLKASRAVRPDKLRMLEIINNSIDKMAHFSHQYLDLAKIESGAMQYTMELLDLLKIVELIVEEARLVANSKEIGIELNAMPIPKIMMDGEKVSMVINNLISNAIKYTPEYGKIVVSVGPGELGVQVQVQDSGIGISQDEIQNVFVRFYQASNVKGARTHGSGVGLAIVKAYSEGHGGRVHVESNLDQGSLFRVEFPIVNSRIPENQKTLDL